MSGYANIPLFVSDRGCPNHCVFCNQKKITATSGDMDAARAEKLIEEALPTIADRQAEIAFFGGSFSGIDTQAQESLLALACRYKEAGKVSGIRLSTRPDLIDDEVIGRFRRFGVTSVELGCQSMDDEVLRQNKRGHTGDDTRRAAHMVKEAGFSLGLQMMTGLLGDSFEKTVYTAREIIALGPDETRIYPVLVIRGTELEKLYREGIYSPLTLDEAVKRCAHILPMFESAGIKVLRIGLMASEGLRPDADLVAGPYHSAFGELVESELMLRELIGLLKEHENKTGAVDILVAPGSLSKMIGNRKRNMQYAGSLYPHLRFRVLSAPVLSGREIQLLFL